MEDANKTGINRVALFCAVVYWALALLVIASGVSRRLGLPQIPLMDKDSVAYLNPALSLHAGGPFQLEHGRSYPYPGMLYLGLLAFNSFKALAILQHLSGVFAGILAILAWNRARALIHFPALPEFIYRLIGLVPALVFLVSSKNIFYEHYLRPESVMPFFVMSAVFLTVQFLRARFIEDQKRAACIYAAALILNSAFLYFVKPSWGINVLFCVSPVIASLLLPDRAGETKRSVQLAFQLVLPGVLVLALLWWPDHLLKKRDPMGGLFLPETLLTIHADIVLKQLGEDIQKNETPYPTELLASVESCLRTEMQGRAKSQMGTLEFDADYLLYLSPLFPELLKQLGTNEKLAGFCFYYYKRAFIKQPLAMARKIGHSMKVFYQSECPVYESEKSGTSLGRSYADSVKLVKDLPCQSQLRMNYLSQLQAVAQKKIVLKKSSLGRDFYMNLRFTYLPSLALALVLCTGIYISGQLRPSLWLFAAFVLLLFAYNFGTSLTVSMVHTLGIRRYVRSQQIYAAYAQFLALALVLELAARMARHWLHRHLSAHPAALQENKPVA